MVLSINFKFQIQRAIGGPFNPFKISDLVLVNLLQVVRGQMLLAFKIGESHDLGTS